MIKKILFWVATLFLAYEFGSKGIEAFMQTPETLQIISSVGFLSGYVTPFSMFIGVVDSCVALLLLFYHGSWRPYLLLYAALWPLVPATTRQLHGMDFEVTEVLLIMIAAALAYYLSRTHVEAPAPATGPATT